MREVKRRAKVGDKVKIVNASIVPMTDGKPEYKNGDILEIIGDGFQARYAEGMSDDRKTRVLNPDEYVVLEGEKEMRFKVGDKVRGIAGIYAFTNERMTKATVTEVHESGAMKICVDEHLDGENMGKSFTVGQKYFEPYIFTLSDLKPCMVVRIRSGELGVVSPLNDNELVVNIENGVWHALYTQVENDMTCKFSGDYDIMEVYGFSQYGYDANKISTNGRELLFKREEPKPKHKMTVAEICKELGEEIEIVKGE